MKVGKSVWFAKRISGENAQKSKYAKPIEIKTQYNYLTIQPAVSRGYIEVMAYGERVSDTWTGVANGKSFSDFFHKGDVMWVDDESPFTEKNALLEKEYGYGTTANAVVKNAVEVNFTIALTLERNQNQVKQ